MDGENDTNWVLFVAKKFTLELNKRKKKLVAKLLNGLIFTMFSLLCLSAKISVIKINC